MLLWKWNGAVSVVLALCVVAIASLAPPAGAQGDKRVPSGRSLDKLIDEYLGADESTRGELRAKYDSTYRSLKDNSSLRSLRKRLLKVAAKLGPKIDTSGTNYFYDEETRRGKYIVRGKKADTLFIGLHGGGVGSGDAGSMAAGMGGGGYVWIFPEVLEKTERGWVDAGTDRFVLELVEAAKRTFGIDPNRVYITGHSMGGHGAWSLAAHHPDIFAGGAAYAGGPTPIYRSRDDETIVAIEEGLIPNLYSQTFLFFQSGDDPRVPPEPNDFAAERLAEWKLRYPEGFNYRYERVNGRGHGKPAEGYLETQNWVASHSRNPRPKKFLWQPTKKWKHQFYWLYWHEPQLESILEVEAGDDNRIEITMIDPEGKDPGALTLFLGEPLVDLSREVVVVVNGEERFRGEIPRTLSTLLWSMERNDEHLLFDARVDLPVFEQ